MEVTAPFVHHAPRMVRHTKKEKALKIGFVQCEPVLGDLQATIERIDPLLRRTQACDLLVLPELCNSGYNFRSYDQAWETSEEVASSTFIDYLATICHTRDMHIVSGLNERDNDALYNTAVLVGPEGYIGSYRKLHLFVNEKDYFQPGNTGLPVFDIGVCTVGMLICFDWIFPEVWRIVALQGADVICHPSNLVLPGLAQRAVPVHALTNRIFVVTANRIGTEGNLTFTGCSIIVDPRGDVLREGSAAREETGVVEADITMARDKKITERNDLFEDRRSEVYSLLTQQRRTKERKGRC